MRQPCVAADQLALFRRGPRFGHLDQLDTHLCMISVDFLHIERAHEVEDATADDLTGHHDWKTGRIRNHEVSRYELRTVAQAIIDFLAEQLDVLAILRLVGGKKTVTHISFARLAFRIVAILVVEMTEVRQIRNVLGQ